MKSKHSTHAAGHAAYTQSSSAQEGPGSTSSFEGTSETDSGDKPQDTTFQKISESGLTMQEEQMIEENFPEDPELSMRLYGQGRNAEMSLFRIARRGHMMKAAQLQRARTAALQGQIDEGDELPDLEGATGGPSFGDTLEREISRVDQSQEVANEKTSAFVAGEEQNLHEVMISMNKAKLQFELMSEVRSRGLEAYQKLMQTQI